MASIIGDCPLVWDKGKLAMDVGDRTVGGAPFIVVVPVKKAQQLEKILRSTVNVTISHGLYYRSQI